MMNLFILVSLFYGKSVPVDYDKPDQDDNQQQQAVSSADKPVLIPGPRGGLNLDKKISPRATPG
jgi:hypothetical protein